MYKNWFMLNGYQIFNFNSGRYILLWKYKEFEGQMFYLIILDNHFMFQIIFKAF